MLKALLTVLTAYYGIKTYKEVMSSDLPFRARKAREAKPEEASGLHKEAEEGEL